MSWRRVVAMAVVTLASLGSGCAIGPDDEPRDIDPGVVEDVPLSVPAAGAAAATGSGRIYLLAPGPTGAPTSLATVARDVEADARAVLQALLAGPNADEIEDQYRTALPADLRLLDVRRLGGGVLAVDITDEITQLEGDALIAAVAQIVFTASVLGFVQSVLISVEGTPTQWPTGNGELTSEPLTVFDYPGLEPSSQPPYPGLPPPE